MKKNKITIKYFIIIFILIIGILPMINFYQHVVKYDFNKLFNTDEIQKEINYIFYTYANISLEPHHTIIGKDGFLFLGNAHGNGLHKSQGIFRPQYKDINKFTSGLKEIQNWYEVNDIKFAFILAPSKWSIYKKKLPLWMDYDGMTITDDILKQSYIKNIKILDLRKKLNIEKKKTQVFFRTVSHWNRYGAHFAFDETINYINKLYALNLHKPIYELKDSFIGSGDLTKFLKIKSKLPKHFENAYKFRFNESINQNVCLGKINKVTSDLEKCRNVTNPILRINKKPQYVLNKEAENKKTLLLICDSFCQANSELYNLTFDKIYKIHWSEINGSKLALFIRKIKPDFVIYQVVEREFYNNTYVKKLPSLNLLEKDLIFKSGISKVVVKNNTLSLSGWALYYSRIDSVELHVNDTIYIDKQLHKRPDVLANYKKYYSLNTGFKFEAIVLPNNLDHVKLIFKSEGETIRERIVNIKK